MVDAIDTEHGCPALHFEFAEGTRSVLSGFRKFDELRRVHPVFRSTEAQGYHVFTEHDTILTGLQDPGLFSSRATVPTMPDPPYNWVPLMIDPPDHTKWRRLLGGWFTPKRIESMDSFMRDRCAALVDEIAPRGACDFVADFAGRFPTGIFLEILGLPIDELGRFMAWEDAIMHYSTESDPDHAKLFAAMGEVQGYFADLIAERRAAPGGEADDIVSAAVSWSIDGAPVSDDDLLGCMLLLFMAGLDTVASQLSYTFHHLAGHPSDRARMVADPQLVPVVVEESLRAFPIVMLGRRVSRDVEFAGCPLKAGEMVSFALPSAGRDEKVYPHGTEVDLDRGMVRNISFGAGPHRCLGSHLARRELAIALEEWHRRIPDYRIIDAAAVSERAGNGVFGIERLPLTWAAGS
jgi:cytochrome P450